MKHLALFLLATLAHADIYIQRVTSEQTDQGYIFRFVQSGTVYCWGMPQMLDQAFIPPTWTPVTQAAIDYRWTTMTGDAATSCLNGPAIPRTVGGNYYTIGIRGTRVNVLDDNELPVILPAGIPCGDKIMQLNIFYAVEYNGYYGFADCR